jgi:hypothetical protein
MTGKTSYLFFNLGISVFVLVVQAFATTYFWYWSIKWLDILMHVIGGIFIGSMSLYLYYFSGYIPSRHFSRASIFVIPLCGTALIGIFWEFFEYILDTYVSVSEWLLLSGGVKDLLSDLFNDLVGSIFASIFFIVIWKKDLKLVSTEE